jgi:hypothetical protein
MAFEIFYKVLLENWALLLPAVLALYFSTNFFNRGLNKYPGPLLASLTNWWRLWDVYKRRPEITHIKLHEKHGDIVRLGPNTLSFSDPQALKSIYGLNKGFIKVRVCKNKEIYRGLTKPSRTSTPFKWLLRQAVVFLRCLVLPTSHSIRCFVGV